MMWGFLRHGRELRPAAVHARVRHILWCVRMLRVRV